MALTAELEALVAKIDDQKQREATRKELEEGVLRQADYSKKMNDLDKEKQAWRDWHARENPKVLAAQSEKDRALGEAAALRARIAELEKASNPPPGDEELPPIEQDALARETKRLEKQLTDANNRAAKLEEQVTNLSKKLESDVLTSEKYNEDVTKRGDRLGSAIFDVFDKQLEYQATFGKKLDRNKLIEEAQKRGGDLDAAYEVITKEDREAKLRADIEKEFETKYNDRIKNSNLPVDQGGIGEPNLGPLQARLAKKDTGIPDNIPADASGQLSSAIGAELRAEGKF